MSKRLFILLLLVLYPRAVSAEINLALHKSYTISPKPNYRLCTDEGDKLQLTDGKSYGSDWRSRSTVGWQGMVTTPEITIDLEKKSYIDEVRVHSIGGGAAGVKYPAFIAVLVSEDGENFGCVRLIDSDDLPAGKHGSVVKVAHTFVARDLRAEGRFVKVLIVPKKNRYIFLDEVEVVGDRSRWGVKAIRPQKLKQFTDSFKLVSTIEKQLRLKEKIAATIETAGRYRGKLDVNFCKGILSELEQLADDFAQSRGELFPAEKLSELNRSLNIIRSKIYSEICKKPYACVPVNPMEVLKEKDMPIPDAAQDLQLDIELWQGEYESAAINIINCTDKAMRLCISVSPLTGPGGVSIDSKGVFTIRRGVFANATSVGPIADALVLQNERPFSLESGSVVQIWLTIFNPVLAAGNYRANIAIAAILGGQKLPIETVPITINVSQIKFPRTAALNSCVCAYPQVAPETRDSLAEAMEDLRSHHTNVFVAHSSDIPFPRRRPVGARSVFEADYSHIDRLIAMSKYARTYLFFFNFREKQRDWGRFGEWMTPAWKIFFPYG